jgi:hypothetical protein
MTSYNELMKNLEIEWNMEPLASILWFGLDGMTKRKGYTICGYCTIYWLHADRFHVGGPTSCSCWSGSSLAFTACSRLTITRQVTDIRLSQTLGKQRKRSWMKVVLRLFELSPWYECRSAGQSDAIKHWSFMNEPKPACRRACPRSDTNIQGMLVSLFISDAFSVTNEQSMRSEC